MTPPTCSWSSDLAANWRESDSRLWSNFMHRSLTAARSCRRLSCRIQATTTTTTTVGYSCSLYSWKFVRQQKGSGKEEMEGGGGTGARVVTIKRDSSLIPGPRSPAASAPPFERGIASCWTAAVRRPAALTCTAEQDKLQRSGTMAFTRRVQRPRKATS